MRILHIVASIESEAAGPSVSVPRLAEAQARLGASVEIATVGDPTAPHPVRTTVQHRRYPQTAANIPLVSSLFLSHDMQSMLAQNPPPFDVIHSHGLWLAPNIYPARAAKNGAVWTVAPRGMLGAAALKFSALKKKAFWMAAQKSALAHASLIHATSQQEAADTKEAGINLPCVVVPNGVELPPPAENMAPRRTILSLGRVHPKKGLDRLIAAWAAIADDYPDWSVVIAGPDEGGHTAELRARVLELACPRIAIEGPKFGEEKLTAYREAGIFVLPTLHENFAMTVAEALAAGTPVISTTGAPWSGMEEQGCGLWIDHGPEPLAAAIRNLLDRPDDIRAEMGNRGRAWMQQAFSWNGIAKSLLNAYKDARRD